MAKRESPDESNSAKLIGKQFQTLHFERRDGEGIREGWRQISLRACCVR